MSSRASRHDLPLIGRGPDFTAIEEGLESALRRGAHVTLVEGEAGIGKSRMAQEAEAVASAMGFKTVRGKGEELDEHRPFAAIAEAFSCAPGAADPSRRRIAELLASPSPAGMSLQFSVIDLFLLIAEEMAAESPLLLVLDDVQWTDAGTIKTVRSMHRHLSSYPVAVLLMARPYPRPIELDALIRIGVSRHIQLGPLEASSSFELFQAITGIEPSPAMRARLRKAGGNPLFVVELAEGLAVDGVLAHEESELDAELAPDLRLTLLRKIGFLGQDTVSMLKMAAILGSSFLVRDLAVLMDRKVTELLPLIEASLAAGVLKEEGDRLVFRHDLLREAVYTEIPRSVRGALHLQAARALAGLGARPEEIAEHYLLGAEDHDEEAIEWLLAAADRVRSTAPSSAVHLYERALQLIGPADERRSEITSRLLRPLLATARVEEAERTATESLEAAITSPEQEIEIRSVLAEIYEYTGRAELSYQQHLAKAAIPTRDASLGLRLAAEALRLPQATEQEVETVLAQAEENGDLHAISECYRALYIRKLFRRSWTIDPDEISERKWIIDKQLDIAKSFLPPRDLRDVNSVIHAFWLATDAALRQGAFQQMAELARRAKQIAETYGFIAMRSAFQGCVAEALVHEGSWDDALTEAETAVQDALEYGEDAQAIYPKGIIAFVAAHRGDIDEARRLTDAKPNESGVFEGPWHDLAIAAIADAHGDTGTLSKVLNQEKWAWTRVERIWRGVMSGETTSQAELASGAADPLHLFGRFTLALVSRDPERAEEALSHWRGRISPFFLARACEMKAELSEESQALTSLEEAERIYQFLGADLDLRRVTAALRQMGVKRGARGRRGRPDQGWESLTPSELKVADLIAQGLSNPQIAESLFVSRRTVTTHISNIFRKLNLSSRTELAVEFSRRSAT